MTDKKSIYQLKLEAKKMKLAILTGKEKNLKAYMKLRREIAKILTLETQDKIMEKLKGQNK